MKSRLNLTFLWLVCLLTIAPLVTSAQELYHCDSIPANGDFILLKNGDRLSGEINKIQRGELFFQGSKTGEAKVKLRDVSILIGRKKEYEMYITEFGSIIGKLDSGRENGTVKIINRNDTVSVSITDVISLRSYKLSMLDRIRARIEVGYSYSKGSDITRFNLNNEFGYMSRKWQVKQSFSSIYTAGEQDGFERINGNIEANRILSNRWVSNNSLQYQKITELGVKSRIIGITSLGKMLIQNKNIEMDFGAGISTQKEYAIDGAISDFQIEVPLILNFRLFQLSAPNIRLTSNTLIYKNMSIKDRYRIDARLSLGYHFSHLTVSTQVYYNMDNKPLAEAIETAKEDYGIVLSFGYSI